MFLLLAIYFFLDGLLDLFDFFSNADYQMIGMLVEFIRMCVHNGMNDRSNGAFVWLIFFSFRFFFLSLLVCTQL